MIKSMQSATRGLGAALSRARRVLDRLQLMKNLESLRNRRKAVIYISSGYDFNPFETSRLKYQAELAAVERGRLEPIDPFSGNRRTTAAVRRSRISFASWRS